MKPRDDRFDHLLSLARDGNAEAAHDLWAEYGFDASGVIHPQLPEPEEPTNQTNKPKE